MDYLERIKGLREDRDITQSEIAKYLNVAQNTYSQYESGKRELPVGVLINCADIIKFLLITFLD